MIDRRSRLVMERLGLNREPETFEHPSLMVGHPLREHYLDRLSMEKWRWDRSRMP